MFMLDAKAKSRLLEYNYFWNKSLNLSYFDRTIYEKIKKYIPERQIISLCGLRRVGKTTILMKIISDLLLHVDPKEIVYFSFDDSSDIEPLDVLSGAKEITGKEPKYLIFDEVQKIKNWSDKIKIIYDTKKVKIFVSGSESLFLVKGVRESLAGRNFEFEIKGLTFLEYLRFKDKEKLVENILLNELELKQELRNYILTAGFPELIDKSDEDFIRQYIKSSVIDKIIFMDLSQLYSVDNPQNLSAILDIITNNPGLFLDNTTLSQELGIHRLTVSKYLNYLETAHLIKKVYNYSRNKLTSEKKQKKYYPTIISSILAYNKSDLFYTKIVETVCINNTNAKYFWRDKSKAEVDLVLEIENLLPVEIKYTSDFKTNKGIFKFIKKFESEKAIYVTKDIRREDQDKKTKTPIHFIPLYEFLLNYSK